MPTTLAPSTGLAPSPSLAPGSGTLPPLTSGPPALAVDRFTVFAYDLNTNTPLAELPATGLSFSSRLNDAGNASFDLNLSDPHVQAIGPATVTQPWRVALYVDRGGVIVWGGVVTARSVDGATHKLSVQAREFLTWTDQRVLAANYDSQTLINAGDYIVTPTGNVGAMDPAKFIEQVFTDAQNVRDGGSIGITIPTTSTNLPWVQPGYKQSQYTAISQVINDITSHLTPGSGGLDVMIDVAWGAGNTAPTKTLTLSAPRRGRSGTNSGLVVDLAHAVAWTWPEDGTQMGTVFTVTGAQNLAGTATAPTPVGGLGQLPRLDMVANQPQLNTQDMVSRLAAGQAVMYSQPLAAPTITLPTSNPTMPLGAWIIGDDVRVVSSPNEWWPTGIDQLWRVVAHTVTVPDQDLPVVQLTLNIPPVF